MQKAWFPKAIFRILSLLMIFSTGFFVHSQNKISGRILDSKTQKPLTGVQIFINNNDKPENISNDGRFVIESDSTIFTAVFSKKNYKPEVINFDSRNFENITVQLQTEKEEQIQEVVLLGSQKKKYKNKKENPAYAIMQEVWKRKKTNGLANYKDYQYKEYEKIEVGLNNIDSTFMNKKIFNHLEFVFKYADSSNFDNKMVLPVFINETIYKTYGKNHPENKENRIIIGNKTSGFNNNELIASTAKNQFKEIDLYNNTLNFFNIGFTSPAARDGFSIYDYNLTDSLTVNGTDCYAIRYFPKRKETLAFQGFLYISKDTYNIVKATLKSTNKINVNFVNGIYLETEYDSPNDSIFIPKRTYSELEMSISNKSKDAKGMLFKKTQVYSDYKFDVNFDDKLLIHSLQTFSDENLEKSDEFWAQERTEPLAVSEENVYKMVTELEQVPKFKRFVNIAGILGSGYINAWKAIDFGDIYSIFGYNEVEGVRLRAGARTYFSHNDMWRVEGYTAYGFKDQKWKYGFEGRYMFNRDNRATIGFGGRNDVMQLGVQLTTDDGIMNRSFASSLNFFCGK